MLEKPIAIRYYTKKGCPLCEEGLQLIKVLSREFPMEVEETDIYQDDELLEKYQLKIPVVEANGHEIGYGRLKYSDLRTQLYELSGRWINK